MVDAKETMKEELLKVQEEISKKELDEARNNEAKQLPNFKFWDKVKVVSGFYKWFTGTIYKLGEVHNLPDTSPNSLYMPDGIAVTYGVLLLIEPQTDLNDNKVEELRDLKAKDLILIKD